jgi:hypothetical protein
MYVLRFYKKKICIFLNFHNTINDLKLEKVCGYWVKKHYNLCLSFKKFVKKQWNTRIKKLVHNEKK